jgi:hypothetical protein
MVLTLLNAATAASAIPSTLSDSLKLPTRTDEVSVLVSAECTAGDLSADVQVYGYFPEAAAWYMVASITEQGWAVSSRSLTEMSNGDNSMAYAVVVRGLSQCTHIAARLTAVTGDAAAVTVKAIPRPRLA